MSLEDVISPDDEPTKTRRLPGGGALERTDDDALAERTEAERVSTGLQDYDPDAVPPATDVEASGDITDTETYAAADAEADQQVDAGELGPGPEREAFPPSHDDRP